MRSGGTCRGHWELQLDAVLTRRSPAFVVPYSTHLRCRSSNFQLRNNGCLFLEVLREETWEEAPAWLLVVYVGCKTRWESTLRHTVDERCTRFHDCPTLACTGFETTATLPCCELATYPKIGYSACSRVVEPPPAPLEVWPCLWRTTSPPLTCNEDLFTKTQPGLRGGYTAQTHRHSNNLTMPTTYGPNNLYASVPLEHRWDTAVETHFGTGK